MKLVERDNEKNHRVRKLWMVRDRVKLVKKIYYWFNHFWRKEQSVIDNQTTMCLPCTSILFNSDSSFFTFSSTYSKYMNRIGWYKWGTAFPFIHNAAHLTSYSLNFELFLSDKRYYASFIVNKEYCGCRSSTKRTYSLIA